ncbi:glycosyltransferase family 4 protein [Pseudooceanicola sp. C21-150M6]|uniref:glycosyltransferase family 4 protein n=1 Tax=Pseudooceanicola sp. C21-150M6 TaxID=3434355 RepID=UPI003D7F3C8A
MPDLLLNARFLMRQPTGVDRVATELIAALIELGLPDGFGGLSALHPRGDIVAPGDRPKAILDMARATNSELRGHPWEQIALPREAGSDWLLSLCNMGPVFRRRQIAMLHDAQVFRQPESYSRAFRTWYHVMQPRLGRRAAMVLTVSEHSKKELEHFGVVPPGKARVIPNGADHILRVQPDLGVLAKHGLERGRFLLAIGSLAPHKNLAMLIDAARRRTDRSIPLVIAGGGNAQVFGAAGLQASEDVRMIGRVSDEELRALYETATTLVFPSLTEGFGLPPAEAMFCGCPVISSTGGAVPEVCGDATLSRDPTDRDGWTDAMDQVTASTELCHRLAEAGRQRVARFTWRRAAETLNACLAELPST